MRRTTKSRPAEGVRETLQNRRDERTGEIEGHTEPDGPFDTACRHVCPDFIVEAQQRSRLALQALSSACEPQPTSLTRKQLMAKGLFQPGYLLADGTLREVQGIARSGHVAALGNGEEGSDQGKVEVAGHSAIMIANAGYNQHAFL